MKVYKYFPKEQVAEDTKGLAIKVGEMTVFIIESGGGLEISANVQINVQPMSSDRIMLVPRK